MEFFSKVPARITMTDRNPMIIPPKTRISATKYSQNLFVYVFHPVGKHKNKPDIYLIRSIKLTMGFSKPKAKNFRMQGVSSTGSTLLGLFFPNTKVPSRATIIVMEAPKVVYHIYEIR